MNFFLIRRLIIKEGYPGVPELETRVELFERTSFDDPRGEIVVASSIVCEYAPFDKVIIPGRQRYEEYRPYPQGGENDEDRNRFTGKDPLRSAGIKWQSHPIPPLQDRQNGTEVMRVTSSGTAMIL